MKKIILVSGYKGAGKDFVSGELYNSLRNSDVVSFASPMKDILSVVFGISKSTFDEYKNNEELIYTANNDIGVGCIGMKLPVTDFRTIIQKFGSEAMKPVFGDDVWVNLLLKTIDTLSSHYIIVSDWRFINEYEGVHDLYDVVTVRVDDYNLRAGEHDSENQLDGFQFDYRIDNTAKDNSVLNKIALFADLIEQEVI